MSDYFFVEGQIVEIILQDWVEPPRRIGGWVRAANEVGICLASMEMEGATIIVPWHSIAVVFRSEEVETALPESIAEDEETIPTLKHWYTHLVDGWQQGKSFGEISEGIDKEIAWLIHEEATPEQRSDLKQAFGKDMKKHRSILKQLGEARAQKWAEAKKEE